MLKEAYGIKRLIIRTGKTDLRFGIDRLCAIVRTEYGLNPREEGTLYIFCGTRNDRLKALVFEGDGFVLLTKRLLKGMEFKWPRSQTQALEIPAETYMELMNGCEVESSIPYSETGPEPETESNIDASIGDIDLLGAELLLEHGNVSQDVKATESDDTDDVYRVTQDGGISDGSIPEWEDSLSEITADSGESKAGRTVENRQRSPSEPGKVVSQIA